MLIFDGLIPADFELTPASRWPTTLAADSARIAGQLGIVGPTPAPSPLRPSASILIATHNNRVFLTLCLRSVLAHTDAGCEVIVVDNGSADGTADDLRQAAAHDGRVRVIVNPDNRGFAIATNQAAASARGDLLVLLNDDTIVPPGWLPRLAAHLHDPSIGVVGAVTNRAGNEAEVDATYHTYAGMLAFADQTAHASTGARFDIRTATMFCVALRREVWQSIGPLDEQFEVGMFEDEDYAMRARAAGLRVVCAEDSFVHHFGQASLGKLAATGCYGPLFHANRMRWEAKWGCEWQPYRKRSTPAYQQMLRGLQELVDEFLPADATVLVASKGDDALLQLGGRAAAHFPQMEDGGYAGFNPADSDDAIRQLEELRNRGSRFFLLPSNASWWLSHYADFRNHLETSYTVVSRRADVGVIYTLE